MPTFQCHVNCKVHTLMLTAVQLSSTEQYIILFTIIPINIYCNKDSSK